MRPDRYLAFCPSQMNGMLIHIQAYFAINISASKAPSILSQ